MTRYKFKFWTVDEARRFVGAAVLAGAPAVLQFALVVVVEAADLQLEVSLWEWARDCGGAVVGCEPVKTLPVRLAM